MEALPQKLLQKCCDTPKKFYKNTKMDGVLAFARSYLFTNSSNMDKMAANDEREENV